MKKQLSYLSFIFLSLSLNSLADIEEFEDTAETDFPDGYADTDGDGVGDNADAFPSDPSETTDTDDDGVGDNGDVHPGFNDAELTTYLSNNNYAKTSEITDARAGSTLITVSNGVATVELEMEQSDYLQTWTVIDGSTSMDIPADASVKFFRFKMAD